MSFRELVDSQFDFLVREHGFELVRTPPGAAEDAVEFRKYPLAIYSSWHKGELDVVFFVDIEFTASHPVFRPYLSRTFGLHEVLRAQGQRIPEASESGHESDGFILSQDQARERLGAHARALKRHCAPLLRGDLTLLEEITRKRSGGGAQR